MKANFEDYVRANFDVVSTSGSEYNCRCPWHADNAPSLRINVEKGLYCCHGCGKKGSLISYAKGKGESIERPDINLLDYVLNAVARPEKRERVMADAFLTPLMMTTDYWTKVRKLSPETVRMFQLGQDLSKQTATIPFRSESGELLGLVERQLGGVKGPKYHYPMGFKKNHHLFGSWMLDDTHDTVCIVEGPVDALAMWDAGVPALAISGSSMSVQQVKVLKRLAVEHVVLFTDNDEAGSQAVEQMVELLTGTGILWSLAQYGKTWPSDPAACTKVQRRKAFDRAVSQLSITIS